MEVLAIPRMPCRRRRNVGRRSTMSGSRIGGRVSPIAIVDIVVVLEFGEADGADVGLAGVMAGNLAAATASPASEYRGDGGDVVTWGDTSDGHRNDAPTDADFVAISTGAFHSVGLRAVGTGVTWGDTSQGQRNDAPTDANFVAIACGDYHSCGIRETRHLRG